MKLSPLVGLLGHRQVGKTTLLEMLSRSYHVLDKDAERSLAEEDPEAYLRARSGHWVALDECQSVPGLFPELKDWVRRHKSPGQFILSGSVRFTSRDAIKESLTGRIINLELLPLLFSELRGEPLSGFAPGVLHAKDLSRWVHSVEHRGAGVRRSQKDLRDYWRRGGLPGICFLRDEKQRALKIEEHLITMLDRDVRLVRKVTLPLSDIRAVLEAVARTQGTPFEISRIQRQTGISVPTIKKLLFGFEATFLIRTLRIQGSTMGVTYFLEDQAEARHLAGDTLSDEDQLTHFLFTQLRAQFSYRVGEHPVSFQFRTRGGAYVPLCYRSESGTLGVIPCVDRAEEKFSRSSGSIRSFLSAYSDSKILIASLNSERPRAFSDRIMSAPVSMVI